MQFCRIFVITAVAILGFIKNGETLQCWICQSGSSGPCADPFNVTQFFNISTPAMTDVPRLIPCDISSVKYLGNMRVACLKMIQTDLRKYRSQQTTYSRSCHVFTNGESAGPCSMRPTPSYIRLDLCEYCNTPHCNER